MRYRQDSTMNEQRPFPRHIAVFAEIRCIGRFFGLIARRRIHQPRDRFDRRVRFADGTCARVYRETVVYGTPPVDPCVLVVRFRLRFLRGVGHTLFRWESILNTPLFVGFPGYVSKLWLAHDQHGAYRGIYEWEGAKPAESYARSLWRVLAIGSVPGTIAYRVLPGLRRDDVLADPHLLDAVAPDDPAAWWRPVDVT
jgi:hypothetical protein